jgi:large subunit ribosomal protein L25
MEIANIRGEARRPGGRHANERLRRRGLVPAVIYGHGEDNETVAVSRHDLELALAHMSHVIRLEVDGRQTQYLIKDVQYDHLQEAPLHVDLMRVDATERVRVKVALELRGEPVGTHEGGELIHIITDLDVECPLLEIPEVLRQSVKALELGQALHVRELELPTGVRPLLEPDDIVAVVRPRRGVPVAEEEEEVEAPVKEGAAEPEVIGKGPKEGEGDAGGE